MRLKVNQWYWQPEIGPRQVLMHVDNSTVYTRTLTGIPGWSPTLELRPFPKEKRESYFETLTPSLQECVVKEFWNEDEY